MPLEAVQVTSVVPIGNTFGALFVTKTEDVEPEHLEVIVGLPNRTPVAEHCPVVVNTDTLAGQMISIPWSPTTVTSKLHVPVFPEASVTWKDTVVVPNGKILPLDNPETKAGVILQPNSIYDNSA